MRRLAVVLAAAAVAFFAFGTAHAEDPIVTPTSVPHTPENGNSTQMYVHPPMPNTSISTVAVHTPAGFYIWACDNLSAFQCSGTTPSDDQMQPTDTKWTRNPDASDDSVNGFEFWFAASVKAAPGDYVFTVTIVDTQAHSESWQPTITVTGDATATTAAPTTTTARPQRTTTTSSSSTTTSTSTSTTEAPTTTTSTTAAAVAAAHSDSGGSNAAPLAAGVVGVAALATGGALVLRRMRSARGGKLPE
jgi:hypothetical protein